MTPCHHYLQMAPPSLSPLLEPTAVSVQHRPSAVRVKTVDKIPKNTGSIFHIFRSFSYYSVNTIIGTKIGYGVTGIGRNTVRLPYHPFLDWTRKSGNFLDFPHCSFGFSRTVHLGRAAIFFLLIQRVFKYSNDSIYKIRNWYLQNSKNFKIWQVERLLHTEQISFFAKLQNLSRF
jgi:hypothetical protein